MLLIRGDPGSGKSSILLQFLGTEPPAHVLARVVRPAGTDPDPFDSQGLLTEVIGGLSAIGVLPEDAVSVAAPSDIAITGSVEITGDVHPGATVSAVVVRLATTEGMLPLAERLIRLLPRHEHAVVLVDALDQAEDDGADDFLNVVAALLRASRSTGMRLLCSSRRQVPLGFDPNLVTTLDLAEDAPATVDDLREHLERRFAHLALKDRDRVVASILSGAAGNWLWATTNAEALEADISRGGTVPTVIRLTGGLTGLYQDGVRRMRKRTGSAWEEHARPILSAVACAFDDHLTVIELRWITGLSASAIVDTAQLCEPFMRLTAGTVRVFHPDFARWILAGHVSGASEESGHLALAQGLTRFGQTMGWDAVGPNSAARVLDHWCAVIVLDPFSPSFHEHDEQLTSVLLDQSWTAIANVGLDAIEQAALVAPTLTFPGSALPLGTGLRAVRSSEPAQILVGRAIAAGFSDTELDEVEQLMRTPPRAVRWLHDHRPDYAAITMRTLWSAVLRGDFRIIHTSGRLTARLTATAVLRDADGALGGESADLLVRSLADEDLETVIAQLVREIADGEPRAYGLATGGSLLGSAYRERAARQENQEERGQDLRLALAAYREALAATTPTDDSWLTFASDAANTLRALEDRADQEIEELVSLQTEILARRRETNSPTWPVSANLLGDAYSQRAMRRDDEVERDQDGRLALAAYCDALAATTPTGNRWLTFAIDVANTLLSLEDRAEDELEELIILQTEILARRRETRDPTWPVSANLLGDAYRERAARRENQTDRGQDLGLALAAYRDALAATTPTDDRWLTFAIDVANTLLSLPERSDHQLEELHPPPNRDPRAPTHDPR